MAKNATIVFLLRAEHELLRLYTLLESTNPGRGDRFSSEMEGLLALLSEWPRIGRPVGGDFRRLRMSRFPYSLVYKIYGQRIMVHAIVSNYTSIEEILRELQR
jgi:plasmid stabilization system protein ParE